MADEFSVHGNEEKKAASPSPDHSSATDSSDIQELGDQSWNIPDREVSSESAASPKKPEEDAPFPMMSMFGDEEEVKSSSSLDISRLIRGVLARRKLIAVIATSITLLFGVMAFTLMHHSWQAQVTLIKREKQDSFQVGRFGSPFQAQEYSLKTLLDTLLLPSALEETIRRSGIDTIPRKLAKKIDLIVGKESSIFHFTMIWESADKAKEIVNNLADVFVERNRQIRRGDAEENYLYYSDQLESAREKVKSVSVEILSFRREHGVVNLDTEMGVLLAELSGLETEHQKMAGELSAKRESLQRLEKALSDEPEMIVQSSYFRNPLKKKLADLEWEYEQARARYTEKNPKVLKIELKIRDAKRLIAQGQDKATPENTFTFNPIRQELSLRHYSLADDIKMTASKLAALQSVLDRVRGKLSDYSANEKTYVQLQAKHEAAVRLQDNLLNRVEEARVMMNRNEADFDIIEYARTPDEPLSSGRKMMVIAGVILGAMAGVFVALVIEFLDKGIRTRREIAGISGLELGVEFQHVPAQEQIVIDASRPTEPVAGLFRRFANDLLASLEPEQWQSMAIVSVEPHAGRSLVATNLAQAMALKEYSVLLVDADLSSDAGTRPADLYELGGGKPGLVEVLRDSLDVEQAIQQTETAHVRLIAASGGELPEDSLIELGGKRVRQLTDKLRSRADCVLYDVPPSVKQETVFELVAAIGHAILVVRSGQSSKGDVKEMVECLTERGVEIHAFIIADVADDFMQGGLVFEKEIEKKPEKKARKKWFGKGESYAKA
ncbi:MAG: AAA family ATPase [Mariprofundaceae bacterium]